MQKHKGRLQELLLRVDSLKQVGRQGVSLCMLPRLAQLLLLLGPHFTSWLSLLRSAKAICARELAWWPSLKQVGRQGPLAAHLGQPACGGGAPVSPATACRAIHGKPHALQHLQLHALREAGCM